LKVGDKEEGCAGCFASVAIEEAGKKRNEQYSACKLHY